MLTGTWDDYEAEFVLRQLETIQDEQRRLRSDYLALREKYRESQQKKAITPFFEKTAE